MRMGRTSDSVRFLDDTDLTFTLDSRASSSQRMTSMEISARPIVFRASYRDINLITSIVNKAIELYGNSQKTDPTSSDGNSADMSITVRRSQAPDSRAGSSKKAQPIGKARALMSKEQVVRPCSRGLR